MTDRENTPVDGGNDPMSSLGDRPEWMVVLNPTSGTADHVDGVRRRASEQGYVIRETDHQGHAIEIAREAIADGVDHIAAAGGDGTLHEVVRGISQAGAFGDVTLGVVPSGTENLFARYVGIVDIDHGFEVLASGKRRAIDVGFAGAEPFVVSCIAGLPADISVSASSDLKERFGSLAFLVAGFREIASFDPLQIELTAMSNGEETRWSGEALCALVGNTRRFVNRGGQADVEDGLLDVVVIEQMPPNEIVTEATAHRLLGRDTDHVIHLQASQIEIRGLDGEPITFSLDGEDSANDELSLHTRPQSLNVCVGPSYQPTPIK